MGKTFIKLRLTIILILLAAAPAAASNLTIVDSWYDIYGIIYQGTDHGRTQGEKFNVVRKGKTIGTFELFHVEAELSKGKFKSSGEIKSLMKGDILEPPARSQTASYDQSEKARTHFELGLGHLNSKQPKKALQELTIAVRLDPDNPDIHKTLAETYLELNDQENANRELEMVNRLRGTPKKQTPSSAKQKPPGASSVKSLKSEPQAKSKQQAAATKTPSLPPAVLPAKPLKFEPHATDKQPKPEKKQTKPAPPPKKPAKHDENAKKNSNTEPSQDRVNELIGQLRKVGGPKTEDITVADSSTWYLDADEPEHEEKQKKNPVILSDFSNNYNNMAVMKIQNGEFRSALNLLNKALEYHPDDPVYHRNKAVAQAKLGWYKEALETAEIAAKLGDPKAPDLIRLIKSMMKK